MGDALGNASRGPGQLALWPALQRFRRNGQGVRGHLDQRRAQRNAAATLLAGGVERSASGARSLTRRWLPQFDLVPFGIDDPGKLAVLGLIDLVEDVAALGFECRDHS